MISGETFTMPRTGHEHTVCSEVWHYCPIAIGVTLEWEPSVFRIGGCICVWE